MLDYETRCAIEVCCRRGNRRLQEWDESLRIGGRLRERGKRRPVIRRDDDIPFLGERMEERDVGIPRAVAAPEAAAESEEHDRARFVCRADGVFV